MSQSTMTELWANVNEQCLEENFVAVKNLCDQIIQADNNSLEAIFLRAVSNLGMGQFNESLSDFDRSIAIHPGCSFLYFKRSELYSTIGRIDNAIADLKIGAALEANENQCVTHAGLMEYGSVTFQLAFELFDNGKFQEALSQVSKSLELNPKLARAYALRGQLHLHFEHIDQALIDLERAITVDKNCELAYLWRGEWSFSRLDYHSAIRDLTRVCMLNPDNVPALVMRACCFYSIDEFEKSIADCQRAIALNPEYSHSYTQLGLSQFALEKYEDALHSFMKQCLNDDDFDLFEVRGICHAKVGNNRAAIRDLTRALEHEDGVQDECRIYEMRSAANQALGNYEAAIEDISRSIRILPIDPHLLYRRGRVHSLNGDFAAALVDLNAAIELNGLDSSFEVFVARARCLQILERWHEALDDYSTALALDPEYPSKILLDRATMHLITRRWEEAAQDLTKYIDNQSKDPDLNWLAVFHKRRKEVREYLGNFADAKLDGDELERINTILSRDNASTKAIDLDNLFHRSILFCREKQSRVVEVVEAELGENWGFEVVINKGTLTFKGASGGLMATVKNLFGRAEKPDQIEVSIQVLALVQLLRDAWLWSWASLDVPPSLQTASRRLLEIGQQLKINEFTAESLNYTDPELSRKLTIIATAFCDCDGGFDYPIGDEQIVLLVKSPKFSIDHVRWDLETLHNVFLDAVQTEAISDHRLVMTAYLEHRKTFAFTNNSSLRINDGDNRYAEYWFDRHGSLIDHAIKGDWTAPQRHDASHPNDRLSIET